MNPFSDTATGNFSKLVENDIGSLEVGESKQVDLRGKQVKDYRSALSHVCRYKFFWRKRFLTKTSPDGSLWVKRVN
jgi:hypothetical protein